MNISPFDTNVAVDIIYTIDDRANAHNANTNIVIKIGTNIICAHLIMNYPETLHTAMANLILLKQQHMIMNINKAIPKHIPPYTL